MDAPGIGIAEVFELDQPALLAKFDDPPGRIADRLRSTVGLGATTHPVRQSGEREAPAEHTFGEVFRVVRLKGLSIGRLEIEAAIGPGDASKAQSQRTGDQ